MDGQNYSLKHLAQELTRYTKNYTQLTAEERASPAGLEIRRCMAAIRRTITQFEKDIRRF